MAKNFTIATPFLVTIAAIVRDREIKSAAVNAYIVRKLDSLTGEETRKFRAGWETVRKAHYRAHGNARAAFGTGQARSFRIAKAADRKREQGFRAIGAAWYDRRGREHLA